MKYNIVMSYLLLHSFFLLFQPIFTGSSQSTIQADNDSMEVENYEKVSESFPFGELIPNLQNQVIHDAWKNVANKKTFEQQLLEWKNYDSILSNETSNAEQNKYGFHGYKRPIYFYTLENGEPTIKTVGTILNDAQPATAKGLSYLVSHVPSTELILNAPNKSYNVTLISSLLGAYPSVTSACFSVLGNIAITWKDNSEKYVTLLSLKDIKKNKTIDLSANAQELADIPVTILKHTELFNCTEIKGSLFNLNGTKLGVCTIDPIKRSFVGPVGFGPETFLVPAIGLDNHINNADHAVQYINLEQINSTILPKIKPLTLDEKAKRLGLATIGAKKLLEEKNKNKSQN